jgi:hypothetical protein
MIPFLPSHSCFFLILFFIIVLLKHQMLSVLHSISVSGYYAPYQSSTRHCGLFTSHVLVVSHGPGRLSLKDARWVFHFSRFFWRGSCDLFALLALRWIFLQGRPTTAQSSVHQVDGMKRLRAHENCEAKNTISVTPWPVSTGSLELKPTCLFWSWAILRLYR